MKVASDTAIGHGLQHRLGQGHHYVPTFECTLQGLSAIQIFKNVISLTYENGIAQASDMDFGITMPFPKFLAFATNGSCTSNISIIVYNKSTVYMYNEKDRIIQCQ